MTVVPATISHAEVALNQGFVVTNSRNPGTGGAFGIFKSTFPSTFLSALRTEEIDWGYDATYRQLAESKRMARHPVWVGPNGIAIGGVLSSTAGLRPLDATLGQLFSPKVLHSVVMGWGGTIIRRASKSCGYLFAGFPVVAFKAARPTTMNGGWGIPVDMVGNRIEYDPATVAVWATALLGETIVPTQVVTAVAGFMPGYMFSSDDPAVILGRIASQFCHTNWSETYDEVSLVITDPDGYTVLIKIRSVSANVLTRAIIFRCWDPMPTDLSTAQMAVSHVMTHRCLFDALGIEAGDVVAFGPWNFSGWNGLQGANRCGMIDATYASLYGSPLTQGSFQQVGPAKVGLFAVLGLPPMARAVHVIGEVDHLTDPTKIAIDQKFLAFDWHGADLALINASLTADQIQKLANLDVRSVYNLTGQWVTPVDPLLRLNLYSDARAADFDIAGEMYADADPSTGTPVVSWRKASQRASGQTFNILHHFRSLVTWDLVFKVSYVGNLNIGYSANMYDADGGFLPFDRAVAIAAIRNGCPEEFVAVDSDPDAIRISVLGLSASALMEEDTGAVSLANPELNEDAFFPHQAVPDYSSLATNMKAAAAIRMFNPVRSQFNDVSNAMFVLMQQQARRLKTIAS